MSRAPTHTRKSRRAGNHGGDTTAGELVRCAHRTTLPASPVDLAAEIAGHYDTRKRAELAAILTNLPDQPCQFCGTTRGTIAHSGLVGLADCDGNFLPGFGPLICDRCEDDALNGSLYRRLMRAVLR